MKTNHHAPEPAPTGSGKIVLDEVLKDLKERDKVGRVKYGTPLKTNNGRRALVDALQEAYDLSMYLKQKIMEEEENKYKSWDFCESINCENMVMNDRKNACKLSCKAYEFHQYLKKHNLIKE